MCQRRWNSWFCLTFLAVFQWLCGYELGVDFRISWGCKLELFVQRQVRLEKFKCSWYWVSGTHPVTKLWNLWFGSIEIAKFSEIRSRSSTSFSTPSLERYHTPYATRKGCINLLYTGERDSVNELTTSGIQTRQMPGPRPRWKTQRWIVANALRDRVHTAPDQRLQFQGMWHRLPFSCRPSTLANGKCCSQIVAGVPSWRIFSESQNSP